MSAEYTIDYFIKKFEAIPSDKWCAFDFRKESTGQCCAQGHCGMRSWNHIPPEAKRLQEILPDVASINNGNSLYYEQLTPKRRILAALNDLKTK